jgi:hypothetical protein
MWLQGSLLACTFASPCFGYEPKVKVTTIIDQMILLLIKRMILVIVFHLLREGKLMMDYECMERFFHF